MKNKFKDTGLMTTQMMKKECSEYFTTFGKLISMPADVVIRLNLLIGEIKRKESYEHQEKQKSDYAKSLEQEKETFSEELKLRTQLTELNIKYMRQKYLSSNSSNSGDKYKK